MRGIIYSASIEDVQAAVFRIRQRVRQLAEPRLYFMAVALTVLVRQGKATAWGSWDAAPPASAVAFARRQVEWAVWQLLGTQPTALLRSGSHAASMLAPGRVMAEVFYNPQGEITLVSDARIPNYGSRNALKMSLNDPGWLWTPGDGVQLPVEPVEYNPVNTLNQQNGIKCSLPAASAVSGGGQAAAAAYALERPQCPHYHSESSGDPVCGLNGEVCGGLGAGRGRMRTKPRLLVPALSHQEEGRLLLPGAITDLVDKATSGGTISKPIAADLSLLVAWCASDGLGRLDSTRLLGLLGSNGLNELLDKE